LDITYCPSKVRGLYYYLYLIEDIYSRKVVGCEVHERKSGSPAAKLLQRTVLREQCFKSPLVPHSHNGAPMTSVTLKSKMEALCITGSQSRPRASNDNPYSESLFRTLKYSPQWPSQGFKDLQTVRGWVQRFATGYNNAHCHSRIGFVTQVQNHRGDEKARLAQRKTVYEKARQTNPLRWSGEVRNWQHIREVSLNPGKPESAEAKAA
jgi:putative transposase